MKGCWKVLVIRQLQIKTTVWYYTSFRMAKTTTTNKRKKTLIILIVDKDGARNSLIHCWWELVWQFLTKLKIVLPCNPAIALLGIYQTDLKTYVHTKTYMLMFMVALLVITHNWNQPRYFSIDKWINKLWYIHTVKYYSVIKRNELSSHKKTWVNLKCILLSKSLRTVRFQLYNIWKR